MEYFFQFEVVTIDGAYSFKPKEKIDHRKLRKNLKGFIKCDDVSMVVYTKVNALGQMLIDRVFCTSVKDIKL